MDVWKSFKRLSIIHVNGKDMELLDMMLHSSLMFFLLTSRGNGQLINGSTEKS